MRHPIVVLALLSCVIAACSDPADTGPVATVVAIAAGDGQEALMSHALPEPLRVRVTDQRGNPVPGVEVKWLASTGSLSPTETLTDGAGFAETTWTFTLTNGVHSTGMQTATASVAGLPVVKFTAWKRGGTSYENLSFSPTEVSVTAGAASVFVTMHATDDYGEIREVLVRFRSPSETQYTDWSYLTLVDGSVTDGTWNGSITIPQGAETGAWSTVVRVWGTRTSTTGWPPGVTVIGGN